MTRCAECSRFTLRTDAKMAAQGFGSCKVDSERGRFMGALYLRTCSNFDSAPATIAAERLAYLERGREGK